MKWVNAASLLLVTACSGELDVRAYGEAFAEDGIPATELRDGWSVRFDELVVAFDDVRVTGVESANADGGYVFDLAAQSDGRGHPLDALAVATGDYDELHFRVALPTEVVGGNATDAQIDAMRAGRYAVFVAGEATSNGRTIGFEWGVPIDSSYDCAIDTRVRADEPTRVELTLHADHLFADDLEVEPELTFDALAAADTDDDGVVTPSELGAVELAGLDAYQTGRDDIDDLWAFVGNLALTMPHVNGEGPCTQQFVPDAYVGLDDVQTIDGYDAALAGALYSEHCASCHGETGAGDGPLAADQTPRPTDLTRLRGAAAEHDYIRFRLNEGGAFFPYASSMPGFARTLTPGELAQLAVFVHGLHDH